MSLTLNESSVVRHFKTWQCNWNTRQNNLWFLHGTTTCSTGGICLDLHATQTPKIWSMWKVPKMSKYTYQDVYYKVFERVKMTYMHVYVRTWGGGKRREACAWKGSTLSGAYEFNGWMWFIYPKRSRPLNLPTEVCREMWVRSIASPPWGRVYPPRAQCTIFVRPKNQEF